MRFGVLGRMEVRRLDGELVEIPGPARRQLLAALLCRAGALATASTLVDDLWGSAPPRTALTTLRTHVARLRDDLGRDGPGSVIRTEGDGYRLIIGADDLDVTSFEGLIAQAATIADPHQAMSLCQDALALWRDEAYVEFGDAAFAVGERMRLAELRAMVAERCTDLALGVGMSAELIGDLEKRVLNEPYRERGWEQLVLAQYRAGRQADALATYQRVRQLLAADLGVDPGPALQALEDRVLRHDPNLLAPTREAVRVQDRLDRCPYLGLAGYSERDAALFVGRERLTSLLAGRISSQSIVLLTGASGVGKSSLVRAGLLPALRAGALPSSSAWRIEVFTAAAGLPSLDRTRPIDLLVMDQGEEMFTSLAPQQRDALVGRLTEYLTEHDGRLVVVLRSDFFGRLADVELLAGVAEQATVLVGPMRADELRRALVEPAAVAGLRLEPDLVETVMEDVADQPEPLPLLSQAMAGTWEQREGDVLTLKGYRRTGGVVGALENAAEQCYSRLTEEERSAARHLLVRMTTQIPGAGWVRRPILRADFTARVAEESALAALVAARLVVVSRERIEITHDALLVHWPRLRAWLAERAVAAELLRQLDQATTTWLTSGRQATDLHRGARLTAALEWRDQHPSDVSPAEHEFLDASAWAADAELQEARARATREARGRRRLRAVAAVLATVLVVAIATTLVAVRERSSAQRESGRARSAALAADARRLAALSADAPDIATSSLLAVAAYRLQDSPDTRGALLGAVERDQSALWRIQLQRRAQRLVASPDGSRLAAIDNHRDIQVFDAATRTQIARFPGNAFQIEGLTAHGRDIITYGPANTETNDIGRLSVIDIATGRRTRVITTAGDRSGSEPALTPDSRWLLMATNRHRDGGTVIDLFDTTHWNHPPRQFVEPGTTVQLTAGRSTIALENSDGRVDLRSLPSLRSVASTGPQPRGASLFAASPDGTRLARVDPADARNVMVVATTARHREVRLPTQGQGVAELSFSPNGAELAVTTLAGAVTVYRTDDGTQATSLTGHVGPVLGLAWTGSGDETGLYTAGLDSQLVCWSVRPTPRTVTEAGPDIMPPDRGELFGHYVLGITPAQGSAPESRERGFLIDTQTGQRTIWPLGLTDQDYVNQAVTSHDGGRALLSIEDQRGRNTIEIWDLRHHRVVGHLALPSGSATFPVGLNAAISPDGRTAYSSLGATRIGVFELPSGRYVRSFTVRFAGPDAERLYAVPWMFDPHGRLLTAGFDPGPGTSATLGPPDNRPPDQRLGLLDTATSTLVAQARLGNIDFETAAAWSHDGTVLAVGTYSGILTLYDAHTLRRRTEAGVVEPGAVKTASFSPDDHTLITGGTSGVIDFYNVPDLRRMGTPLVLGNGSDNGGVFAWYGPGDRVQGFAPDVERPTKSEARWFTFQAAPAALASTACALAGADITPAQWQRYLGGRPYEHVCRQSHQHAVATVGGG